MIEITFGEAATTILTALVIVFSQIDAHFRCLNMKKASNAHFCYMIFIILSALLVNMMGVLYGCFNIKMVYILIGYSVLIFFDLCIIAMKRFSPLQRFLYFSVLAIVFFTEIALLFGRLYIESAHNLPVIKTDAEMNSFLYNCFLEGFKNYRFPPDVFSIDNLPCIQALFAFFMVSVVVAIFVQLLLNLFNPVSEKIDHQ